MTEEKKMINIVIPICIQNDFIGPKGLSSDRQIRDLYLHGGKNASQRILGTADGITPVKDILEVVHDDDDTYVIYVEDGHPDDPNDPQIQGHFAMFGKHCVAGSDGAKPVAGLDGLQEVRRSQVITTDVLNLVSHPPIVNAIKAIIEENEIDDPSQVRFLVIGGLTDVLVADCARGLNHICGIPNPYREDDDEKWMFMGGNYLNVAVSEKYCFSNNATHHKAALQGMQKVGINILTTDQDIFNFLNIEA